MRLRRVSPEEVERGERLIETGLLDAFDLHVREVMPFSSEKLQIYVRRLVMTGHREKARRLWRHVATDYFPMRAAGIVLFAAVAVVALLLALGVTVAYFLRA